MIARVCILFAILISFSSCNNNAIYDEYEPIPDYKWAYDKVLSFDVDVERKDIPYNLYLNLRHAHFYPFSNFWFILKTKAPDASEFKEERLQVILTDKAGKWFGDCMGDVCDYQVLIKESVRFNQKGLHTFQLVQDMREQELPGIMEAGIRVEMVESNVK